jgi:hypothetical protein
VLAFICNRKREIQVLGNLIVKIKRGLEAPRCNQYNCRQTTTLIETRRKTAEESITREAVNLKVSSQRRSLQSSPNFIESDCEATYVPSITKISNPIRQQLVKPNS